MWSGPEGQKRRAEKRLNGLNGEEVGLEYIDYVRARAALERALARLKLLKLMVDSGIDW